MIQITSTKNNTQTINRQTGQRQTFKNILEALTALQPTIIHEVRQDAAANTTIYIIEN